MKQRKTTVRTINSTAMTAMIDIPKRKLTPSGSMSRKLVRTVEKSLVSMGDLHEERYRKLQDVLGRIAVDLPRVMAREDQGEVDLLMLTVRLNEDGIRVIYMEENGMEYAWPKTPAIDDFDPIALVTDFSTTFGWTENFQLDHQKALTPEEQVYLRHTAEDVETLRIALPKQLYMTPKGKYTLRRTQDSIAFDLKIDVLLSETFPWMAYYDIQEDMTPYGETLRLGVFFNAIIPPYDPMYWHEHRLTVVDLNLYMKAHYGLDILSPILKKRSAKKIPA